MISVAIIGYGKLGQYLHNEISNLKEFKIVALWNRTYDNLPKDCKYTVKNLEDLPKDIDILIEVAHPDITKRYAKLFLERSKSFFVGSPTAFADKDVEKVIHELKEKGTIFIPSGALWGAIDIQKMADRGTLTGLTVTMKKHSSSLKVNGDVLRKMQEYNEKKQSGECVLYEGPVRKLCPQAPNNVNTIACAALAGHNLGFDKVIGRLVCDNSLEAHIIDIDVRGPGKFSVMTNRYNPAAIGAVTGSATYLSFLSSVLKCSKRINETGIVFV